MFEKLKQQMAARIVEIATQQPDPPGDTHASANGFNPEQGRTSLFEALASRVGPENAALMRQDFDRHMDEDPINGLEQAYYCLTGKLIEYSDALNDALDEHHTPPKQQPADLGTDSQPISPFTFYRKEV